jgi:hypothetical protein
VGGKGEKRAFSPSYFNSTPLNETRLQISILMT